MVAAETGFTLTAMLRGLAADRPDAPAVTMDGATTTFGELHARSERLARALQDRGVGPGDRVAVLDKNAPAYFEILFATVRLGAVLVGLNHRLSPREVAAIVHDAAPAVTFVSDAFAGLLPADAATVAIEDLDALRGTSEPVHAPEPQPDDVAVQLYSSGTTGAPKGAMLTHANLSWTPRMGREFYAAGPDSVNLVPSPLFHIGGVGYALTTMGQGGHTVLVRDVRPDALLAAIATHGVTHTFMVPSVIQLLVEHPDLAGTDIASLQRVAYGAAPMSGALLARAMTALGCEFMAVYGMTETAGSVVCMGPQDHDPSGPRAHLLWSIGHALPWLEIRVVDPLDGHDSAPDEVGEIWVRSPQNMVGYWARSDLTADALTADGWLRTGDAASRDTDGYLFLHDRIKDMIVSGGENIYPAEVEAVLAGHPAVLDLAVIGVASERWGETVKAVVIVRDGHTATPAELIAWTRDRLAHYKCPTSVDVVGELPRNASGKLQKHVLRARYRIAPVGGA